MRSEVDNYYDASAGPAWPTATGASLPSPQLSVTALAGRGLGRLGPALSFFPFYTPEYKEFYTPEYYEKEGAGGNVCRVHGGPLTV